MTSDYDLAGRRTRVTLPGSTTLYADYDYDLLGNVTFIRENGATSGVGVLATYQYDSLSRRSSVTFGNGVAQGYTYDNAARLATQTNDLASSANDLTQTFAYNPASQITSVTRSNDLYAWTGHRNENVSSTSNGLNQVTNVGASTVTHDSRGNITAVGSDSYGYDGENQLVSGPASTSLGYDPIGRLYQGVNAGGTTRIGYDGLDRIAEYDGSNAVQRRYIHGPGIDNPIVWYEGSGITSRRFLSSDERGSVISVTDGSGTVLGLNKYDEYGVPQSTNLGKFGYTGQAWVPEVGLWYYKARFYWADGNRFMQTDPTGYRPSPNLYAYVLNDPVNFTDPLGLMVLCGGVWADVCGTRKPPCEGFCIEGPLGDIAGPGPNLYWTIHREPLEYGPGGRTREQKEEEAPFTCADAPKERGEIKVQAGSASGVLGVGIVGATGTWRNLSTGSHGTFTTIGFGAGLSAGASFTSPSYTSLSAFAGPSDGFAAGFSIGFGRVGIGFGYSGSWNSSGSGGGWTFDVGSPNLPSVSVAGNYTETTIANCQPGGG